MDQLTLFGEPEPVKTTRRRRKNEAPAAPAGAAMEMFSAREIAQFGVNSRPLISLSPHMALPLEAEDPRSEAEREADRARAEREAMIPLPLPDDEPEPDRYHDEDGILIVPPAHWGGIDWQLYDLLAKEAKDELL